MYALGDDVVGPEGDILHRLGLGEQVIKVQYLSYWV
jgi:hypothetical protein